MFAGSPVQAIAIAVPLVFLLLAVGLLSIHRIGPNEVGLVIRRWGPRRAEGGPIAFRGEAGYQADLLMPGLAVRVWPMNRVQKHPCVQIHESGAERIIDIVGIVETLEGEPLPSGDIACRMGRFDDVRLMEAAGRSDAEIADVLIGNQNERHNNYQDSQKCRRQKEAVGR